MRINKGSSKIQEGDLTPMIDMVFQLIAFFMVLVNFNQNEQNERIQLPESVLAKPPDHPLEFPITLHLTKEGTVIYAGQDVSMSGLPAYLAQERATLSNRQSGEEATVIIRAHRDTPTGKVQELIKVCQESKFEKFALRAKEDVGN
jgi:biopolymer transport protein ExbD